MATRNPARRELVYRDLDEITQDAELLCRQGYRSVGQWSLAQAAGHVDEWARFPMDGFPSPSLPIRVMLWLMKVTFGRKQLQQIIQSGEMKEGLQTLPETVPVADAKSDQDAANALASTINRLKTHNGTWHSSPLFGAMDRETVVQLTLVHAAHHFSFLIPNE